MVRLADVGCASAPKDEQDCEWGCSLHSVSFATTLMPVTLAAASMEP